MLIFLLISLESDWLYVFSYCFGVMLLVMLVSLFGYNLLNLGNREDFIK